MTTQGTISEGTRTEQLRYASRVLLDSMGLDSPPHLAGISESPNGGLTLSDGVVVPEAKLEEVFVSVTLQRELTTGGQDKLGRFDERAITWDTSKPWIDLTAKEVSQKLRNGGDPVPLKEERFRVIISHDIDTTIGLEPTSLINSVLQSVGLRKDCIPFSLSIAPKTHVDNTRRLLDFEAANDVGAYYFMLSGPYGLRRYSSRYDAKWRNARRIAQSIKRAGMMIGLHGSFYAKDDDSYRKEKERLENAVDAPITCHRNHYLRFDSRKVWRQLEAAGIEYDFSVGFRSRLGFRAGCARAYRTFDLSSGRESRVLSVPLLYMDTLLLDSDRSVLLRELRAALQEAQKVTGCVSL